VSAADRDALIERAQKAATEPLTELEVRERVDAMLTAAGWVVQNLANVNLYAATGVAVREVATDAGLADYLLWVDRKLVGVIEAKREGKILSPVERPVREVRRRVDGLAADSGLADAAAVPL